MKKKSDVVFANKRLEKAFEEMEDLELKEFIKRAIKDIEENAFCGTQIPKKLIPREYLRDYKITNLWKYNLPNSWRLVYSLVTPTKVELISAILEWFNHKNYEKRFKY